MSRPIVITQLLAVDDTGTVANYIRALESERDSARVLAIQAVNGWACYAKRQIEHDEIARLHAELERMKQRGIA